MSDTDWRGLDRRDFLECMSRLAATVHVVTTCHEGRRFGMTMTAACSLSADPMSLILSLHRSAAAHAPIVASQRLCVNMLTAEQSALATRFAGAHGHRGDSRFQDGVWEDVEGQPPRLLGAAAALQCDLRERHAFGTHDVLFCAVTTMKLGADCAPLLYGARRYGTFEGRMPLEARAGVLS